MDCLAPFFFKKTIWNNNPPFTYIIDILQIFCCCDDLNASESLAHKLQRGTLSDEGFAFLRTLMFVDILMMAIVDTTGLF